MCRTFEIRRSCPRQRRAPYPQRVRSTRPSRSRALIPLLAATLSAVALGPAPGAAGEEPSPGASGKVAVAPVEPLLDAATARPEGDPSSWATSSPWQRRATTCAPPSSARCCVRTPRRLGRPAGLDLLRGPGARSETTEADAEPSPAQAAPLSETFAAPQQPRPRTARSCWTSTAPTWRNGLELAVGSHAGHAPAWDPAGDGAAFSDRERATRAAGLGDGCRGLRPVRRRRHHRGPGARRASDRARPATRSTAPACS